LRKFRGFPKDSRDIEVRVLRWPICAGSGQPSGHRQPQVSGFRHWVPGEGPRDLPEISRY